MAFRIDYYRRGERILAVPSISDLPTVKQAAEAGLAKFNADKAHILDMTRAGKILAVITQVHQID